MKFEKGSIRKSLYYSILDGLFNAMTLGVSECYLIPYGIALGASADQIAFLASIPMLFAAFVQSYSARLTAHIGSRTKLINAVVFLHVLSWIPILLIPYVLKDSPEKMPWALLAAATVYTTFGAFSVPAWQSLMSDYIPVKKRGKYFGWRNRLQGILTVLTMVVSGLILNGFSKNKYWGFTLIFGFGMLCRFYAWICLTKMKEPFRHTSHDSYFSFMDFLKELLTSNFGRFVAAVALMSCAVNLSAPLLAFFILKDLGHSYAAYMMIVTTAALSGFIFQGIWGKYGDLDGNLKILKVAGWGIAVTPLLWLVSRNLVFIFFVQVVAGAFWGGFNLLVTNFVLEALPPEKRIRGTSYFNAVNSFFIFVGSVAGGFLFHHLPPIAGYSYLTLFLLSCVGRILVVKFMIAKVKEVRSVQWT